MGAVGNRLTRLKGTVHQRIADCIEHRPRRKDLRYALTVLRHPIDEFFEMKRLQKGSTSTAVLLVAVLFLAILFDRQTRSFMHNTQYNTPLDIFYELRVMLIPMVLFVVANWSVTTLMNGKGRLYEIFWVLAYSLQPLILMRVLVALVSYLLSLNDGAYLTLLIILGWIWFGVMLYIGIMQVHEYTFGKAFVTLLLTAVAAVIIVFICLLFFSLIQELIGFVYSVYRELFLRIYS